METRKAQQRFTAEVAIEAIKQMAERGRPVTEEAVRLGVGAWPANLAQTPLRMVPSEQRAMRDSRTDEVRRPQAEFERQHFAKNGTVWETRGASDETLYSALELEADE